MRHTFTASGEAPSDLQRGLDNYDRDTVAYLAAEGVSDATLARLRLFRGQGVREPASPVLEALEPLLSPARVEDPIVVHARDLEPGDVILYPVDRRQPASLVRVQVVSCRVYDSGEVGDPDSAAFRLEWRRIEGDFQGQYADVVPANTPYLRYARQPILR